MIDRDFMVMFVKYLAQFWIWLGGQHSVGMVLGLCLPVNTCNVPGHEVDHGCDNPVESFVGRNNKKEFITLFLILYLVMSLNHK